MSDDITPEEEELPPSSTDPEQQQPDALEEGLGPASIESEQEQPDVPEPTKAPSAQLRLIRGGQETGDTYPIHGRAVIGRFDPAVGPIDVDLGAIPEAMYISRRHAAIEFADGAWTITDLGSSNGTFVLVPGEDFKRIEEPTTLADGSQISLGNARFAFHWAPEEGDGDMSPGGSVATAQ